MRLPAAALVFILITALSLGGCDALKDKKYTASEAEKKLASFCLKEGNLNVITKQLGKTLWVYAPLQDAIFDVKPSSDKKDTERKIMPYSLLSLQSEFSQKYFKFNFDVVTDVLSGEPTTYGSSYNETYTKKRQLIYQALQESLFNAKGTDKEPIPQFIVILVADINRGVATKSIVYLRDLRQYMTEAVPPDEYYMREINEVIGQETMIHDTKGLYVPYAEISWTYFLTEQIKNRIKFKFTASDFPPDTDPVTEIATMAANTLRLYPFGEYAGVVLYDVRAKKETVLAKEELKKYAVKTAWEETQGRLTTIRFEVPKDPTQPAAITAVESKKASE
ncbi:MAG: hypothetical protein HQL17_00835 [Candidatus Omnitrophica bacterium]|nr:hypothetical protein [Candidatus Omnitrophota bacterium]